MLLREVLTSTPGAERKVCRCRQAFLPTSAGTQLTGRNHTHLTADKSRKSFLWFSPVNQQCGLYPLEHLSPGVSHCKHSAANTAVLTACSLAEGQPCSHASFLPGSPAQLFPHRITHTNLLEEEEKRPASCPPEGAQQDHKHCCLNWKQGRDNTSKLKKGG